MGIAPAIDLNDQIALGFNANVKVVVSISSRNYAKVGPQTANFTIIALNIVI